MISLDIRENCKHYFAFCGRDTVLRDGGVPLSYDNVVTLMQSGCCACCATEKENGICSVKVSSKESLPRGFECVPLRLYNDGKGTETALLTSRAKTLVEWIDETRFCPKCGKPLRPHSELTAMECPDCGNIVFPRINPCVIVLVRRGKKMLLARHVQRNQNIYACIAGFMEAGETAEQAVEREIMEETGIKVRDVKYFGSQSWPYPSQLMLGFTAEYESGELRLQESEIADAGWFDATDCPATPQPGSIAYSLIHDIR